MQLDGGFLEKIICYLSYNSFWYLALNKGDLNQLSLLGLSGSQCHLLENKTKVSLITSEGN